MDPLALLHCAQPVENFLFYFFFGRYFRQRWFLRQCFSIVSTFQTTREWAQDTTDKTPMFTQPPPPCHFMFVFVFSVINFNALLATLNILHDSIIQRMRGSIRGERTAQKNEALLHTPRASRTVKGLRCP